MQCAMGFAKAKAIGTAWIVLATAAVLLAWIELGLIGLAGGLFVTGAVRLIRRRLPRGPSGSWVSWVSAWLLPLIGSVGYAVLMKAALPPDCSGHQRPVEWAVPIGVCATAGVAALAVRAKEPVAAVIGLALLALLLASLGLALAFLYVGAARGCWK